MSCDGVSTAGSQLSDLGFFTHCSPQRTCVRETEILVEQQPPQGVFVCDHAGLVINEFSIQGPAPWIPRGVKCLTWACSRARRCWCSTTACSRSATSRASRTSATRRSRTSFEPSFILHFEPSLDLHFEPSLDALSLRSDVISSLKILSLLSEEERAGEDGAIRHRLQLVLPPHRAPRLPQPHVPHHVRPAGHLAQSIN